MKFFRTCKETGERKELSFSEAKERIEHNGWNFSDVIEACKKSRRRQLTLNATFAVYDLECETKGGA